MTTTDTYMAQIENVLDTMATDPDISDAALDAAYANLSQRLIAVTQRLRFTGR